MKLFLFLLRTHQTHRFVMAVEYRCGGMDFMNFFLQRLTGLKILHFGEKEEIGSTEMR